MVRWCNWLACHPVTVEIFMSSSLVRTAKKQFFLIKQKKFWFLRKKMYICKVDVHWKCKCTVKIWSTNFDSKIKKFGKLKFLLYTCKVETNSTKVLWEIFTLFELIVYLLFAPLKSRELRIDVFETNRPTRAANAANQGIRVQNGRLYTFAEQVAAPFGRAING